jgi:hypothetical protein
MSVGMKFSVRRIDAAAEGARTRVPMLVKLATRNRAKRVKSDNLKERK